MPTSHPAPYLITSPICLFYCSVFQNLSNKKEIKASKIETISPLIKAMLASLQQSSNGLPRSSRDRNWTDSQLYKLASFMLFNIDRFKTEKERKESKVYAILSKYMQTRNVNQCRNYVQKMCNKFQRYEQVIDFFRESLPMFEEKYREEREKIEKIIFPLKTISKMFKGEKKDRQQQGNEGKDEEIKEEEVKKEESVGEKRENPSELDYAEDTMSKANKESNRLLLTLQEEQSVSLSKSQIHEESNESAESSQERNWRQCHEMFLRWTTKAYSLLDRHIRQPVFYY